MKRVLFIIPLIVLFSVAGCKKDQTDPVKQPIPLKLPQKAKDIIEKSNSFGVEFFRLAALDDGDMNMMLSPLSASAALTMLLNGCEGETYVQIREMLGFEGLTIEEINETYRSLASQLLSVDPEVDLVLANAVWYHHLFTVKDPFLATMAGDFDAHVEALDFYHPSALDAINGWASDNTNGKIKQVLNEISPNAVMFLMNALYFKGEWTWQFDENLTDTYPFYLGNGTNKEVEMMVGNIPVRTAGNNGYSAVEMYYGRQNFSIVFILPGQPMAEFLQEFDGEDWSLLTSELDATGIEPISTDILLPKFTFEYEKELNEQLKSLGMIDAFDPVLANLDGISDQDIFVSFVKQNTFINLDEQGTEAAAVTTIGIELTALPDQITIDKPFIFAIRERTSNTLLFIGKVMEP